ncbi:sensor histidine kinase [Cellulomonas sp. SLBN-39]|uniref:sensor histidine kinase n=1 Tax=Cellulomonas sp. SLBN-39 TaxID=2768446 RepID=UPI00116F9AB2|nr:histidine kinase [Cellulomonas sp. SLBN-39]TQL02817.1 signal transduction histidine kinase [Cellulomonas sp. SLBN-39]
MAAPSSPAPGVLASPGAWWDSRLTRAGLRSPVARDALLAVTLAAVMLAGMLLTVALLPGEDLVRPAVAPWVVVVVVLQSLAVVLRRVQVVACVAVVVACQVTLVALAPDASVRSLAPFVAGASAATVLPARSAARLVGAAAAVEAAGALLLADGLLAGGQHALSGLVVWGGSLLVGLHLATRRAHLALVRERADAAERERDARVHAAIAAERAHLARELHDVAAHHLSGMVVQAAAVERLVGRDPDAARAGAVWLRDQGRETLDNLRQVVGLLRSDDRDGLGPLPGVDALEHLVRTAQALGDDVTLVRDDDATGLPPLADVSLYRVAQQALTNARQHAPGAPVHVRVTRTCDVVLLDVENGPASTPVRGDDRGGTGLLAMRERAALVGGTLDAGPTADGGWRVHLRVPGTDGPSGPGGAA